MFANIIFATFANMTCCRQAHVYFMFANMIDEHANVMFNKLISCSPTMLSKESINCSST